MRSIFSVALLGCILAGPTVSAGTYYVVERSAGEVWAVHSDSGAARVVASGLGEMIGVTVDRHGRLFVSQFRGFDPEPGTVALVDPVSGEYTRIEGTAEVFALSADPDADVLYVGGYNTGLLYRLEETSPGVWTVTNEVDLGAPKVVSHALKDGNSLYVACQDSGVWVKDLVTGTLTFGVDIPQLATTMAKEKGGHLIVGSEYGTVYRIDPATWQVVQTYSGFNGACGIAVDPRDNSVLVADPFRGSVSRLNLTTGEIVTVTTVPVEPWQIACVPWTPNPSSDFTYSTNGSAVTITGYTGSGGEVVVPDTIEGLPVVSLGDSAFSRCAALTAVTIPNTVTNIGAWAFDSCTSLTSITIPNSVTSLGDEAFDFCGSLTTVTIPGSVARIGWCAFRGCTNLTAIEVDSLNPVFASLEGVLFNKSQTMLIQCPAGEAGSYAIPSGVIDVGDWALAYCGRLTSITLPNSVASLGDAAFLQCNSLTNITIPDSVTRLGDDVFSGCTSLINITIPASVMSFGTNAFAGCTRLANVTILHGVSLIADTAFSGCSSLTNVTIPDSVISVGNEVFSGCAALTSITLPNSVSSVGEHAFFGCTSLTNIAIPDSVADIGDWAFAGCTNLANVTIPNSLTLLGDGIFSGCASLTSVTIPDSVTSIGMLTFGGCTSLTNMAIPDSVSRIGDWVFAGCTSLVSVAIGTSLSSMGENPFYLSTSLNSITVDASNTAYSSLDGILFNQSQTSLVRYPAGRAGSYAIPEGVTSIGSWAFDSCSGLTGVTIPSSVDLIGSYAFSQCSNLTSVYVMGNAPLGTPVPDGRFYDSYPTLYYLAGATGWGTTFADRPTALWLPRVQTSDATFGVRTNRFGFAITWASGKVIVVEACSSLAEGAWVPLQTNTLDGGSVFFSDPEWMNHPARFYRIRSP